MFLHLWFLSPFFDYICIKIYEDLCWQCTPPSLRFHIGVWLKRPVFSTSSDFPLLFLIIFASSLMRTFVGNILHHLFSSKLMHNSYLSCFSTFDFFSLLWLYLHKGSWGSLLAIYSTIYFVPYWCITQTFNVFPPLTPFSFLWLYLHQDWQGSLLAICSTICFVPYQHMTKTFHAFPPLSDSSLPSLIIFASRLMRMCVDNIFCHLFCFLAMWLKPSMFVYFWLPFPFFHFLIANWMSIIYNCKAFIYL